MDQKPRMANLRVGAKSHTGNARTENQDRMGRFLSPFGELYIVVDGMGGHKGGATAAAMTVDGLEAHLRNIAPGVGPAQALQIAAQRTNADIYQKANDGDPETSNMGATLVLGLASGSQLIIAHAGDSRAYLFRDRRLSRLTRDHSVVQRMIDRNLLTEEQARDHPDSSVITRAFGQKPEIEMEVSAPLDLREGDGILLCTDGLCGYVDDKTIEQAIGSQNDAQQITDALIELALSAGGLDNVTVQFLQFGQPATKTAPLAQTMSDRQTARGQLAKESLAGKSQIIKIGIIIAGAVAAVLIALYLAGIIPGAGPSKTGGNENERANANQNRSGRSTRNASQASGASPSSAAAERETVPDPNAQAVEGDGRREGDQSPAPGNIQNPPPGSVSDDQRRKPVAIAIPFNAAIAETGQRNFADLDVGDSRVLVILSALWDQPKGKTVYYRDDSFRAEAERIRARLGYSREQTLLMPDNLARDFPDYDIIIRP